MANMWGSPKKRKSKFQTFWMLQLCMSSNMNSLLIQVSIWMNEVRFLRIGYADAAESDLTTQQEWETEVRVENYNFGTSSGRAKPWNILDKQHDTHEISWRTRDNNRCLPKKYLRNFMVTDNHPPCFMVDEVIVVLTVFNYIKYTWNSWTKIIFNPSFYLHLLKFTIKFIFSNLTFGSKFLRLSIINPCTFPLFN